LSGFLVLIPKRFSKIPSNRPFFSAFSSFFSSFCGVVVAAFVSVFMSVFVGCGELFMLEVDFFSVFFSSFLLQNSDSIKVSKNQTFVSFLGEIY
jgi:hypothetical protein